MEKPDHRVPYDGTDAAEENRHVAFVASFTPFAAARELAPSDPLSTLNHGRLPRVSRRLPWKRIGLAALMVTTGFCVAIFGAWLVTPRWARGDEAKPGLAQTAICATSPIARAINQFINDIGSPPERLQELFTQSEDEEDARRWKGPYLEDSEGLLDPWGHSYQYRLTGGRTGRGFELRCLGPDGVADTEDDLIVNME